MGPSTQGQLERLALEALGLGADALEVEYRNGHEDVVALKAHIGVSIARLACGGAEATQLREELAALARRKRKVTLGGEQCELRATEYDSFGERAFTVAIHRLPR